MAQLFLKDSALGGLTNIGGEQGARGQDYSDGQGNLVFTTTGDGKMLYNNVEVATKDDIPEITNDLTNELKSNYDEAFNKSHIHDNKIVLDKLDEDSNGNLLFNGKEIKGGGQGGSIVTFTTTEADLYGKTITITKGSDIILGTFDDTGVAILNIPFCGETTITVDGKSSTYIFDYFGDYEIECNPTLQRVLQPLTSKTSEQGSTFSSGSQYASMNPPWYAFDGKNNTSWWSTARSKVYVGFQFNEEQYINTFKVRNYNYYSVPSIKDFTLQASNDGIDYVDLTDTITFPKIQTEQTYTYKCTKNLGYYKYYRLYIYNTYPSEFNVNIAIIELALYRELLPTKEKTIYEELNQEIVSKLSDEDGTLLYNGSKISTSISVEDKNIITEKTDGLYATISNDLTDELKNNYDLAAAKAHSHINKSVIDKFTETDGKVLYDGEELGGKVDISKEEGNALVEKEDGLYVETQSSNIYNVKAFSEDVYSTDEQMIGVWMDNKPLYRKCFTLDMSSVHDSNVNFSTGVTNIENTVSLYGTLRRGNSDNIPIPLYMSSEYNVRVILNGTKGNGTGIFVNAGFVGTAYMIMEYTKTTDTPIIVDHDVATEAEVEEVFA